MSSSNSVYDILGVIADFDDELSSAESTPDSDGRRNKLEKHLQQMSKLGFKIPDFEKGLDWLNVSEPLSFSKQLKGQIVVLDFFTYCCINCMHILPDLEAVEELYPPGSGVLVVGVHSAKFLNEKVTANITSAILRYGINHPVVNDKDATLWQTLAVSCWPTLLFIGPSGELLYSIAGEGHRSRILEFLETAVQFYSSKGQLQPASLPISLEIEKKERSVLSFPGKVCFWPKREWLLIADSGNHRIIITDVNGIVQAVIGSGKRGCRDGSWAEAKFSSPQGLVGHNEDIYVADTENHCLRKISLLEKSVSTVVGTGKQDVDVEGGKLSTDQEISSPWDVALGVPHIDDDNSPVLFVAMSGSHQIWAFFLSDRTWFKKSSHPKGTCLRFAGSGKEENRNNAYPEKASFAQPSGMAVGTKGSTSTLYIADSESSSIRTIGLPACKVSGLVGGEKDPTNLFAFGDEDGKGTSAKLQHPLGVALLADEGPLIVADSYNHKIKAVDLTSNVCETLAGTGHAGSTLNSSDLRSTKFNEPGGLSVDRDRQIIYVADTNNHAIKVIDYTKRTVFQLPIVFSKESSNEEVQEQSGNDQVLAEVSCPADNKVLSLSVPFTLSPGEHINVEAPNAWKLSALDDTGRKFLESLNPADLKGKLIFPATGAGASGKATVNVNLPSQTCPCRINLRISTQIFACLDKDNVCLPSRLTHYTQTVHLL